MHRKTKVCVNLLWMLLSPFMTIGQHIFEGVTVDSKSKKYLGYVTIGIPEKSGYFYSNIHGGFSLRLTNFKETDTIEFSFTGYSKLKVAINQLKKTDNIIELSRDTFQLKEVKVISSGYTNQFVGVKDKKTRHFSMFTDGGAMVAQRYTLNDSVFFIHSFTVFLGETSKGTKFRFKVFKSDNNLPSELIFTSAVDSVVKYNKTYTLTLLQPYLCENNDIFIAVEHIPSSDFKSYGLPVGQHRKYQNKYQKYASTILGKWNYISGPDFLIGVNILVPENKQQRNEKRKKIKK